MKLLQAVGGESSDDDELFHVRGADGGGGGGLGGDEAAELDAVDSSRPGSAAAAVALARWDTDGASQALRDRFVTGSFRV